MRLHACLRPDRIKSYVGSCTFIRIRCRAARALEGGQAGSSRRPQSPVTQAVESQFRKMMQGLASSIEAATGSLKESLDQVLQRLTHDLGDNEGGVVEKLQVQAQKKCLLYVGISKCLAVLFFASFSSHSCTTQRGYPVILNTRHMEPAGRALFRRLLSKYIQHHHGSRGLTTIDRPTRLHRC